MNRRILLAFLQETEAFMVGLSVLLLGLLVVVACNVTPAQHAANVGEATQARAEYQGCRESAKDGGTFASFCACVRDVDAKHHVDGGPCE
jgi:hypothetical protein